MISYEEFKEEFENKLMALATEEEKDKLKFDTLKKVNTVVDTVGLCGSLGAYQGGPCLYLRDSYRAYLDGADIEEVAAHVLDTLRAASTREFKLPDFDWDYVKGHVVLQLINMKQNEHLLRDVPHRAYLDLVVVYRCILERSNSGTTSCIISNALMKSMGVTEEDLYLAAYSTTPLLLMPRVYSMCEILYDLASRAARDRGSEIYELCEKMEDINMWVISDTIKQMGAYLLLYPDLFKGIMETKGDLYIIPSSIHELIALPVDAGESVASLSVMIREVNRANVAEDERLSDNLYRYDSKENKVVLA